MTNKKYMMSGGLAFSEQNDLEKLRKKAAQGWMVKRFKLLGYQLEKAPAEDVVFSIDYRDLKEGEDEEYFDLFEMGGWKHVCSDVGIHLFKACPGIQPIYSDKESTIDKLMRQKKPLIPVALMCIVFTVISYMLSQIGPDVIQPTFHVLFFISMVITLPAVLTCGTLFFHLWKEKRLYN